jgi:2-dehydro-3-deoxygluconokinase
LQAAADCDLLYLTGITLSLFDSVERRRWMDLAAEVRNRGGIVAFDPNYRPQGWPAAGDARGAVESMAPYVDILLTTDADERLLFGSGSAADVFTRWRHAGVQEVVLKRGGEGAMAHTADECVEAAIPRAVKVLDSTGAGDSFNAAYLWTRLRGGSLGQAADAGNVLAGAVVQVPGAILPREQMPLP